MKKFLLIFALVFASLIPELTAQTQSNVQNPQHVICDSGCISSGGFAQVEVQDGSGNWTPVGFAVSNLFLPAVLQAGSATIGAISNTSFAATQSGTWTVQQGGAPWSVSSVQLPAALDFSGFLKVHEQGTANQNLTQIAGSAITLGQKVMASSLPVALASDQSTLPVSGPLTDTQLAARLPLSVIAEGKKKTYSAAGVLTVGSNATFLSISPNNGGRTIKVLRVYVSVKTSGTATGGDVQLSTYSTEPTGGTATSPALVPNDPSDAASIAVVNQYTVAPSLGVLVGLIRDAHVFNTSGSVSNATAAYEFAFGALPGEKPIILTGTYTLILGIAAAVATQGFSYFITWTEE